MITTAIVLAGGKGSRLKSVVSDIPKPMAPVNGSPFLAIILKHLQNQGIEKVILAVGYKYEVIQEYFGDTFGNIDLVYSVEQIPLGTGGAIKRAFETGGIDEALVVNGDTFIDFSLKPLYEFYSYCDQDPVLLLKHLQNFDRYGSVDIDESFMVTNFNEKQYCKEGYINAGVYLFHKSVFDSIEDVVFSFEKEVLESKNDTFNWHGYMQHRYFKDIGIPIDYHDFINDHLNDRINSTEPLSKTLFLDRDGVINTRKVGGYIESCQEFEFIQGSLEAIQQFSQKFDRIVIVTNQQGIGKGMMEHDALNEIHTKMNHEISKHGGRIDAIFVCPDLAISNPKCRKPNTGMAIRAKLQMPKIDFSLSIMIGDSKSDIEFGQRMGMKCIGVGPEVRDIDSWKHVATLSDVVELI